MVGWKMDMCWQVWVGVESQKYDKEMCGKELCFCIVKKTLPKDGF